MTIALNFVQAGNSNAAIEKILAFKQDATRTRYTLIRLLISTSQYRDEVKLTRCALDASQRIKAKAPNDLDTFYDIANGYQVFIVRGTFH